MRRFASTDDRHGRTSAAVHPDNAAFDALAVELTGDASAVGPDLLSEANKPLLRTVLQYHVLTSEVGSAAIPFGRPIATAEGSNFKIDAGTPPVITDGRNRTAEEQLFANQPLLTAVLTYHVVPARVFEAEVPIGAPITTVEGGTVTVGADLRTTDERGRAAGIVGTDVMATNGVVHVIDRVILPGG